MVLYGCLNNVEVGTREWGEGAMDGVGLVLVAAAEAAGASQGRGRGEGLLRMWGRGWLAMGGAGGGGVAVSACVLS